MHFYNNLSFVVFFYYAVTHIVYLNSDGNMVYGIIISQL